MGKSERNKNDNTRKSKFGSDHQEHCNLVEITRRVAVQQINYDKILVFGKSINFVFGKSVLEKKNQDIEQDFLPSPASMFPLRVSICTTMF